MVVAQEKYRTGRAGGIRATENAERVGARRVAEGVHNERGVERAKYYRERTQHVRNGGGNGDGWAKPEGRARREAQSLEDGVSARREGRAKEGSGVEGKKRTRSRTETSVRQECEYNQGPDVIKMQKESDGDIGPSRRAQVVKMVNCDSMASWWPADVGEDAILEEEGDDSIEVSRRDGDMDIGGGGMVGLGVRIGKKMLRKVRIVDDTKPGSYGM
ncbi:hypothetical protein EIP86_005469 [Pleurotus ostreatoroseus]|nr:hypothetical protein EIP86_005469 [Pleurotus ostreatoroseus]